MVCLFSLVYVPSANMEDVGFMTYSASQPPGDDRDALALRKIIHNIHK